MIEPTTTTNAQVHQPRPFGIRFVSFSDIEREGVLAMILAGGLLVFNCENSCNYPIVMGWSRVMIFLESFSLFFQSSKFIGVNDEAA